MRETVDQATGEIVPTSACADAHAFIAELDGGVFEEKLATALAEVASAVVRTGGTGRVRIDVAMKPLGSGHQVAVTHKLAFERPTMRGRVQEEDTTETPMYVGRRGNLSLFPEDQHQMFSKDGKPSTSSR